MVLSYKFPGEEAKTLPLELSATTEEVKEYVRDMHSIAAPFKLRFYVKRRMVYLAKATTLGESGVEADSTIGISYTDTPEKQAIRNNQLCSTSELKAS